MLTKDVLAYYGGRVTAVAEAIGVTRDTVYKWPKKGHVPAEAALKLQVATRGALAVNPVDYAKGVPSPEARV